MIGNLTVAQMADIDSVEKEFNKYAKTIIKKDLKTELGFLPDQFFNKTSKENYLKQIQKQNLELDSSVVKSSINQNIIIKSISDPVVRKNKQYHIIEYVLLKKIVFTESFLSQPYDKSKFNRNPYFKKHQSSQGISYDNENHTGTYAYHYKVLSGFDQLTKKWFFLSERWIDFSKQNQRNTNWDKILNTHKEDIADLRLNLPRSIRKRMQQKSGYFKHY